MKSEFSKHIGKIEFKTQGSLKVGHFRAMANPCSIFIEHDDAELVQKTMY